MSLPFLQPYFGLSNSLQTAQASIPVSAMSFDINDTIKMGGNGAATAEKYNGTSWTTITSLPENRYAAVGGGNSTFPIF